MTQSDSIQLLHSTISSVLSTSKSPITDEDSPATISGWDSVAHLNLMMAIEEAFGVTFSPEEMLEMTSVGAIRTVLKRHGHSCGEA